MFPKKNSPRFIQCCIGVVLLRVRCGQACRIFHVTRLQIFHGAASLAMGAGNPTSHVMVTYMHDDVIKWKHFPRYWPFVRGIHRSPVNSPHKGQWRGALMISLICVWIKGWENSREAGDLRRPLWRHCNEINDTTAKEEQSLIITIHALYMLYFHCRCHGYYHFHCNLIFLSLSLSL